MPSAASADVEAVVPAVDALGVDPVHRRLLRHPPQHPADGLVAAGPGPRRGRRDRRRRARVAARPSVAAANVDQSGVGVRAAGSRAGRGRCAARGRRGPRSRAPRRCARRGRRRSTPGSTARRRRDRRGGRRRAGRRPPRPAPRGRRRAPSPATVRARAAPGVSASTLTTSPSWSACSCSHVYWYGDVHGVAADARAPGARRCAPSCRPCRSGPARRRRRRGPGVGRRVLLAARPRRGRSGGRARTSRSCASGGRGRPW